jgi:hypothetical protein
MVISKCPNPTVLQDRLSFNDFCLGSCDFPYTMGHISFMGELDAITVRAGAPAIAPEFTLEAMAKHPPDFWQTVEDVPDSNNRVTKGAEKWHREGPKLFRSIEHLKNDFGARLRLTSLRSSADLGIELLEHLAPSEK